MSSAKKAKTPPILSAEHKSRMHPDEFAAWEKGAADAGMPLNIFVRRIMGAALGISELVERVDNEVAQAKINRAHHMRTFGVRAGSEVERTAPLATRRAS